MCVYVVIYLSNMSMISYHPSDSYFTPPWGVSTNQGKDIRAYVNGFDFYFSSVKGRESVKSPLRHCDSPIKLPDFVFSWCGAGNQDNFGCCAIWMFEIVKCVKFANSPPNPCKVWEMQSRHCNSPIESSIFA